MSSNRLFLVALVVGFVAGFVLILFRGPSFEATTPSERLQGLMKTDTVANSVARGKAAARHRLEDAS